MVKKIENKIKKADAYAKSILNSKQDDSGMSALEKEALSALNDGSYKAWREKSIKVYNQEENWKRVEAQIKGRRNTPVYRTMQFWQSIAAVFVIFILAGGAYFIFNDLITTKPELIQPGTSLAYLEVNGDERIALAQKDTVLQFSKTKAMVNSGKITYSLYDSELSRNEYHKINVPRNGEYYVVLPDGTKAWVNSASSIGFYSQFSANKRIIELQGEAYFEVEKDSLRPFIVRTTNMDVRVLGTHFNVKAYADEDYTYTTLSEGKVQLTMGEKRANMIPNQQIVLDNLTGKYEAKQVDASIYTAWKDGKFIFRDEPLENIMSCLSRWYDIEVFYPNQDIKKELFSMRVNRYEDIDALLKKMEKTGALRFTLSKKAVVVER
ncbi:FecR family protein [Labilibaculum filiforme]|nr:FecR domain-containing protein [Labilibaculum filiforme]